MKMRKDVAESQCYRCYHINVIGVMIDGEDDDEDLLLGFKSWTWVRSRWVDAEMWTKCMNVLFNRE